MRIDLGQLAAKSLVLELPARAGATANKATIAAVEALRGSFSTTGEGFALSDVSAAELALAELAWLFGTVSLATDQPALLTEVAARASGRGQSFELELTSAGLVTQPLALRVGDLTLRANVEARDLTLAVGPQTGRLTAGRAIFRELALITPSLRLSVPELSVTNLLVDWSGIFRLEAGTAQAGELTLSQDQAAITARGVVLAALVAAGRQLSLGQARVVEADVRVALAAAPGEQAAGEARASATPSAAELETPPSRTDALAAYLDLRMLDALAGRIDADVYLDIAVPILGKRRATHSLRLAVAEGAIDFRALESGLATLEDSLLDFSVRDGALVLERGLPLIATRGRGKPLLRWELGPDDLALAQENRVRIAVLPNFQQVPPRDSDPPPDEASGGAFALRQLSLRGVDVALSLMQPSIAQSGALRELTFANLTVRGEVHHQTTGPRPIGSLSLGVASLRALLADLPLGTQRLSGRLEIAGLREAELGFEDLRPQTLKGTLEGLAIAELALG